MSTTTARWGGSSTCAVVLGALNPTYTCTSKLGRIPHPIRTNASRTIEPAQKKRTVSTFEVEAVLRTNCSVVSLDQNWRTP